MTMKEATSLQTTPERLSELSRSRQIIVRRGVALNPVTPYSTLLELALSNDNFVCRNVFKNPSSDEIIRAACVLNKPFLNLYSPRQIGYN